MSHDEDFASDEHKKSFEKDQAEVREKFEALNAVMRARLEASCNSNECEQCGNADCVIANQIYMKLWPENAPDLMENETVTCPRTSREVLVNTPAHEKDLFDLFFEENEEEAA